MAGDVVGTWRKRPTIAAGPRLTDAGGSGVVERPASDAVGTNEQMEHATATNDYSGSATSASCSSPGFSLVIPAYNEARRLPRFLETVREYAGKVFGDAYEVIVVDDGSTDATARIVNSIARTWPQLRLLRLPANGGKGKAVRIGVASSRGDVVLFADADGACPIAEEAKLRNALREGNDVAIGSRRVGRSPARTRVWYRQAVGWCFAALARRLTALDVRDTQCGFKMFRGPIARQLFASCSRDDYLFDIFILVSARLRGLRIAEVGVSWHEVAGSQLHLVRDSWKMMIGLLTIRRQVTRELRKETGVIESARAATHTLMPR